MALSTATVSFDAHQILGSDFDSRRTKCRVYTNVVNQTLIDTSTGETRMGDETVTVGSDGTGTFTTWIPGADGNPISWQTYVAFDYPRTGARDRTTRVFGPYTITGTSKTISNKALTSNVATLTTSTAHGLDVGNTVTVAGVDATFNGTFTLTAVTATTLSYAKTATNVTSVAATGTLTSPNVKLALLEEEQAVPPEYETAVTARLDAHAAELEADLDAAVGDLSGYVTDAETAKTGAEDARDLAEQYRDEAHDISGISTSDGVVEALINDSGSDTSAALSASFVALGPSPLGTSVDVMPSFRAAMDSLVPGGELRLAEGDYTFSTRDEFDKVCTIRGAGKGQTRVTIKTQGPVTVASDNVTWAGITFVGDNAAVGNETYIFDDTLTSGDFGGWHFEDCVFDSCGVKFAKIGATFPNGTTRTVGTGVAGSMSMLRCEVKNHEEQYGIDCLGVDVVDIIDCWVHHNGTPDGLNGEGIKIEYGSTNVNVRGGVIEDNYRDGIDCYSGLSAKITGVTIRNNAGKGIECKWDTALDASLRDSKIVVSGCDIYGNDLGGIVAAMPGMIVNGNHVYDNGINQISSLGAFDDSTGTATERVTITNNQTSGGDYGINLAGAVTDFVIAGNICTDHAVDGIHGEAQAQHGSVTGNVSRGNTTRGIRMISATVTITGNDTQDGANDRRIKTKASSTARSTTVVPALDLDLSFSYVPANSTWIVRGVLYLSAATEVPDFKAQLVGPSGATGRWNIFGGLPSMTSWNVAPLQTGASIGTSLSTGVDDAAFGRVEVEGTVVVGATAGTISLYWSQNTSDATATNVLDGSWLSIEKVA